MTEDVFNFRWHPHGHTAAAGQHLLLDSQIRFPITANILPYITRCQFPIHAIRIRYCSTAAKPKNIESSVPCSSEKGTAFYALSLLSIQTSRYSGDTFPSSSVITFTFAPNFLRHSTQKDMSKPVATPELLSMIYRAVWNTDLSNYTIDVGKSPTLNEIRLFGKVGVDYAGFAFEFAKRVEEEFAGYTVTFVHTNTHCTVIGCLKDGERILANASARCLLSLPKNHGGEIESPHDQPLNARSTQKAMYSTWFSRMFPLSNRGLPIYRRPKSPSNGVK